MVPPFEEGGLNVEKVKVSRFKMFFTGLKSMLNLNPDCSL